MSEQASKLPRLLWGNMEGSVSQLLIQLLVHPKFQIVETVVVIDKFPGACRDSGK